MSKTSVLDVPAEVHFTLAQFLQRYTALADKKDPQAAAAHLDGVLVTFPTASAQSAAELEELFTGLWAAPAPHRHDVFNLVTNRSEDGTGYVLTAHYQKWLFAEGSGKAGRDDAGNNADPFVDTLGNYRLTASTTNRGLTIDTLTVVRDWTK